MQPKQIWLKMTIITSLFPARAKIVQTRAERQFLPFLTKSIEMLNMVLKYS